MLKSQDNIKKQAGQVIWVYGRPCAGKTTLAASIYKRLTDMGFETISFDGDEFRKGLNNDLGFTIEDRKENIRRAAELAQMVATKGYIVICSFVTPTLEMRNLVKKIVSYPLHLFFACAPLEICMNRDIKGHYKKAREGQLKNFTGIASPFEEPKQDDYRINTAKLSLEKATDECINIILS